MHCHPPTEPSGLLILGSFRPAHFSSSVIFYKKINEAGRVYGLPRARPRGAAPRYFPVARELQCQRTGNGNSPRRNGHARTPRGGL